MHKGGEDMKKALNNGQETHRVKLPTTRFNEKHGIAGPELFWLFFFGSLQVSFPLFLL